MAITSLSAMRAARGSFAKITENIANMNKKASYDKEDDGIWQCKLDDAKNGSAIIRFLPAVKEGDEFPYVRMYSHGFKGPTGKWMISNCLTTLGQKDPVCDANDILWADGTEASKVLVRERKRKLAYYSNVLIISDPANPENEGTVKIFRYGAKIFEKLSGMMKPEFADEDAVNPFDVDEGANFRLKITQVAGYANFDKSAFAKISPLADTDEKIMEILNKCKSLSELISPDKFKSYEELQRQLDLVLGTKTAEQKREAKGLSEDDEAFLKASSKPKKIVISEDDLPDFAKKVEPVKKVQEKIAKEDLPDNGGDEDEDSDLAYFRKLSQE